MKKNEQKSLLNVGSHEMHQHTCNRTGRKGKTRKKQMKFRRNKDENLKIYLKILTYTFRKLSKLEVG